MQERREFKATPEPEGKPARSKGGNSFVIRKHHALRPHCDFRLEMDSVMKNWAVTRGRALSPTKKRLAVHVE
ncbi:MAG: hypothetical protein EOR25_30095 [Mesorhizobium sp.]|nr:MAG: hypothetical protein EOR24_29990 [Mesorhizobium sp.]RWJ11973.1 MAG: hypothetical protein EOR25_30095 [Mesorhizobium sp.]